MQKLIDKSSPIPLYVQVAEWMEQMIKNESYPVGSKLPAEGELAVKFVLNRNTIRQAIALLVRKGYLQKQKGVGTFVIEKRSLSPIHELGKMTSFVDDFDMQEVELEDSTILQKKIKASPELAAKLMLNPGDEVVQIERIRIANRTPLVLERQFYSFKDFGELLNTKIKGSMYRILVDRFHADLHHSIQTIHAIKPSRKIAALLCISGSVPCILLESLAYNSNNTCIEILQSFYRGDRYLFKVETGQYRRGMSSDLIE